MAYIEKEPIIEFIQKGLNDPDKTKAFGFDAIQILAEIEFAPEVNAIVPPCKIGDMIYEAIPCKYGTGIYVEREVVGFHIGEFPDGRGAKRKQYFIVYHKATNKISHLNFDQLGKTLFFSKEEALQVLKESNKQWQDI